MAAKSEDEAIAYVFQWKIENVSQCWWMKKFERIASPTFIVDEEGTKWSLWLYIKGCMEGEIKEDEIVVKLHRESDCGGPESVVVSYNLTFLDKDGSSLNEARYMEYFKAGQTSVSQFLEDQKTVFVTRRDKFLSEDTLTIQCTLGKDKKVTDRVTYEYLYARTVFKIFRRPFCWKINKFSTLEVEERKKFKNDLIEFDLFLNVLDVVKTLDMDMISFNECIKYISLDSSIVDWEGQKKRCGVKTYFDDQFKKGVLASILMFPMKFFEDKHRYLPNDVLSLEFDVVLSTVMHSDCRTSMNYGHAADDDRHESILVLTENFKSIYTNNLFSDIVLHTKTDTFPAHKAILSARSPVFNKILHNNMLERDIRYVDIGDLDFDTVNQMLLFIYSGVLQDLQLESAMKLYMAADKYGILTLKRDCCSFMTKNLCPEKACNVLVFAHRNHDNDFINAVQDYILGNEKVFKSSIFKPFMEEHLQLAADILYRKINRDDI